MSHVKFKPYGILTQLIALNIIYSKKYFFVLGVMLGWSSDSEELWDPEKQIINTQSSSSKIT